MKIIFISLLILTSASLHIWAEYQGPRWQIYVFKPLTTLLIILVAIWGQGTSPNYRMLILLGLCFSLMGDIFLMLPEDRFLAGLIAFSLAHCFYIGAFVPQPGMYTGIPLIPLVIFGILVYASLASSLGSMRIPVIGYIGIILMMAWFAWERWLGFNTSGPFLAAMGASLFVLSDTLLAINKFRTAFPASRALSLGMYFTAQLLIAGSVGMLVS